MRRIVYATFFKLLLIMAALTPAAAQEFVQVQGNRFMLNGRPYHFVGVNYWYGMNLASAGPGGDRARLLAELDHLQAIGVTNLRIMAAGEGPDGAPWRVAPSLQPAPGQYNPELLDGLDFLLAEMGKRNLKAVVCLNNFWPWSGGFAQYYQWSNPRKRIPYPPPAEGGNWLSFMLFSARFYADREALDQYERHIRQIVGRTNAYTGRPYADDPAIMAWQLANEPRGMLKPKKYRRWIEASAALIKSLAPRQLVTIGSEGNTPAPTGNHFSDDHRSALIDYTTIHIWVQNWMWYDPLRPEATYDSAMSKARRYLEAHLAEAEALGKPLVLEEFGMARDADSHAPEAPVTWRDRYFTELFGLVYEKAAAGSALAGCNVWAWGGAGRPRAPKAIWQAGDNLIGDPPHEYQGWYSIYDQDATTIAIIKGFSAMMAGLR